MKPFNQQILKISGITLISVGILAGCGNQIREHIKSRPSTLKEAHEQTNSDRLESLLKEFFSSEEAARKIMDAIPTKYDQQGVEISAEKRKSIFSKKVIESKDFVIAKDKKRQEFCKVTSSGASLCLSDPAAGRAAIIATEDEVAELVDNNSQVERNIVSMDSKKLTEASLPTQPWSDTYWPLYAGATSYRYNDNALPLSSNWKENFKAFKDREAHTTDIESLSPAEKYDLLTGDADKSLTNWAWRMGQQYYEAMGSVESWMGLCHGWAAAAFMLPRPNKDIVVMGASGKKITFHPSDVKALGTLIWAQSAPRTRFIGRRCDKKEPAKTSSGRVLDKGCFDNNPGAFHMSTVNQIGISKRSFVMDATYDYEVWNQPIQKYSYRYFNPLTHKATHNIDDAIVRMSEFASIDRFKNERKNSKAVNVVGVSMELTYVAETDPSAHSTDNPDRDDLVTVHYTYDLELDEQNNIIGGEWYSNTHPDFLWLPAPDAIASNEIDAKIPADFSWDPTTTPFPSPLAPLVALDSESNGSPLWVVVRELFKKASEQ